MSTINGITYFEEGRAPSLTVDRNGTRITRRFKTTWASHEALVNTLFGKHKAGNFNLTAHTVDVELVQEPIPHPGWPNMFCESLSIASTLPDLPGSTAGEDIIKTKLLTSYPGDVLIDAVYAQRDSVFTDTHVASSQLIQPDVPAYKGTWLSYEADHGGEVVATGHGSLIWEGASGDNLVQGAQGGGIIVPSVVHQLTWNNCIAPPWYKIRQSMGKVDTSGRLFGAASGTLMLVGVQPRKRWGYQKGTITGGTGVSYERPYYDVTFSFAEQVKFKANGTDTVGWNYFYRSTAVSGEHWVKILTSDDSQPLHPSADLSLLIAYGC